MLVLQRLLGALVAVALLVAAFFITSVLLAVVAVVALAAWVWIWWRTRNLPRSRAPGDVIQGEYRIERETGRGAKDAIEGEYRIEREIRRGDDDTR